MLLNVTSRSARSFGFASFLLFALLSCSSTKHRVPSSIYQTVLWIGDSQTHGNLGKLVYPLMTSKYGESNIELYGVGSSSPRHWSQTRSANSEHFDWMCDQWRYGRINKSGNGPVKGTLCETAEGALIPEGLSVFDHVNRSKPDLVVFQFLGNSMGWSQEAINQNVGNLLKSLDDRQECIFISSPPFLAELVEANVLRAQTELFLANAVGDRCHFVYGMQVASNMRDVRSFYNDDRIHLSPSGAEHFYNLIKNQLF